MSIKPFSNRPAAAKQIRNFDNALCKGYYSVEDAVDAWKHALTNGLVGPPEKSLLSPSSPLSVSKSQHYRHQPSTVSAVQHPQHLDNSASQHHLHLDNTNHDMEHFLAELAALRAPSNEECWWVVVRGDHPGVYFGLSVVYTSQPYC